MRRSGLLLPLLVALACGRSAGNSAEQSLAAGSAPDATKDPMMTCTDAVLVTSPMVERVTVGRRANDQRRRYVVLRNPPSQRATTLQFAVEPSRGAPHEMVVGYTWPGPWQGTPGMQPSSDANVFEYEGKTLGEMGAQLLREARAQCAPSSHSEVVCSRVEQGRTGRCSLGI